MQKKFKKTILIDLDGVLNEYKGEFDINLIPKPRKGAREFLKNLSCNYELKLFTARNKPIVKKWLNNHELESYFIDITNIKEKSYLIIDDRCLKFNGDYSETINNINNFKPWYKNNL